MRVTAEFQDDGGLVLTDGNAPFLTISAAMARSLYDLMHDRYKSRCPCSSGWLWSQQDGRWKRDLPWPAL